jgi:hypothetical protein
VVLERLARGQAQGLVGVARGDGVEREPLLGRADTARHAQADHERIRRFELFLLALGALVAVVLHVAAVELEQLGIGLRDGAGHVVGEALFDGAAQIIAVVLDALGRIQRIQIDICVSHRDQSLHLEPRMNANTRE